jgi:precorrin-2 dehydrogenase/sirohydrochlorin ferrochelatase
LIVDLHLKGNLVIVVGGGNEALKKVESLLTQDCKILVISDKVNFKIKNFADIKKIQLKKMKLENVNFLSKYSPYLVMASTDSKSLNRKIIEKAKKMHCLAYASDDPDVSDFSHPSVINIEDTIQVAVSTGGKSPIMAKKLKSQAEKIFKKIVKKEDIFQIKLQEIARNEAKKKISTQKERKKFLYTVINDKDIKQLIKENNLKKAQKRAMVILKDWK